MILMMVYYLPQNHFGSLTIAPEAASEKCFRIMWNGQDEYSLYNSKGSFATCSICNICNKYLSYQSGFNFGEFERNILRNYRRDHLSQQELARQKVDHAKTRCQQVDEHGQPKECLFYWDAMSNWSTQTPKQTFLGGRTNKSDSAVFADRIMACEIYCLDIDIIVFYHSNEFVKGGANYMIEVVVVMTIIIVYLLSLILPPPPAAVDCMDDYYPIIMHS